MCNCMLWGFGRTVGFSLRDWGCNGATGVRESNVEDEGGYMISERVISVAGSSGIEFRLAVAPPFSKPLLALGCSVPDLRGVAEGATPLRALSSRISLYIRLKVSF